MASKSKKPKPAVTKPSSPKVTKRAPARARPSRAAKTKKPRAKKEPSTSGSGFGWRLTKAVLSLTIWSVVALGFVLAYYAWDLPDIAQTNTAGTRKAGYTILAKDETVLARTGDIFGETVSLSELPSFVPDALIAIEDRRFYSHPGVDLVGIARAMWVNISAGGLRQGGSTLTQQVAKNLFLSPDRTLKRKIQEVMLAFWLEHSLSKEQILEIYLNRVYLGAGAYGVDAASRLFFGRPARDVTLFQAAVLAGLPKAPSRLNPLSSPTAAAERANLVLDSMVAAGSLSASDAKAAKRNTVATKAPGGSDRSGRYFADWVVGRAADTVGNSDQDLIIQTTLDPALQKLAEESVKRAASGMREGGARQIAIVAMDPDGAVRALVGGTNWLKAPFNRAVHGKRQPGSTFKLFVYLAALEAGMQRSELVDPRNINLGGWSPSDFAATPTTPVTLEEAFIRSLNTGAVVVGEKAGRDAVINMARRLGVASSLSPDRSLALGVHDMTLLEMTGAYAAVANGGYAAYPYGVRQIQDRQGKSLFTRSGQGNDRLFAATIGADMDVMLKSTIREGTGRRATIERTAGGKTGTTQDYRDAWFVGYTNDLVTGVWVGNDDATPMQKVTGGSLPAEIWKDFMVRAITMRPERPTPYTGTTPVTETRSLPQSILDAISSGPETPPAPAEPPHRD